MKKRNSSTIILILVFVIGLSLMLYPSFSNYWNSFHASEAIIDYENQAKNLDDGKQAEMLLLQRNITKGSSIATTPISFPKNSRINTLSFWTLPDMASWDT